MSLFSDLLRLHRGHVPTEDFLTEVVAHLMRSHQALTIAWLEQLGVLETTEYRELVVKTQARFTATVDTDPDSRLDILIELIAPDAVDWIVVESKLDAPEGRDQLRRYAAILAAKSDVRRKVLIFLTRDHASKNATSILPDAGGTVVFRQARWHDFYHLLKAQQQDEMVAEVARFMEELGMSDSNRITPLDLMALTSVRRVLRMMNGILLESTAARLREVIGNVDASAKSRLGQLERHNRYILVAWLPRGWWCGVGFGFPADIHGPYPGVYVVLEVDPKSPSRSDIIQAMREIELKRPEWRSYNLSDPLGWAGISFSRSLADFLPEEDHVAAIKAFLGQGIEQVAQFKTEYPHLPWTK